MKRILLLVPDLMLGTRVEQAAKQLGYETRSTSPGADYAAELAAFKPDLVILTFDRAPSGWEELIRAAHGSGVQVLAFGSHSNVDAFKRARELGADEVVANSRLNSELPKLLKRWLNDETKNEG